MGHASGAFRAAAYYSSHSLALYPYTWIGRPGFQAFVTDFVGTLTALFGNESPGFCSQ